MSFLKLLQTNIDRHEVSSRWIRSLVSDTYQEHTDERNSKNGAKEISNKQEIKYLEIEVSMI